VTVLLQERQGSENVYPDVMSSNASVHGETTNVNIKEIDCVYVKLIMITMDLVLL
jgi:hypothetical protein